MAYIPEHKPKEEGKCYYVEWSWINFLIWGYSVCDNNFMEGVNELINFEMGWGLDFKICNLLKLYTSPIFLIWEYFLYLSDKFFRNPK